MLRTIAALVVIMVLGVGASLYVDRESAQVPSDETYGPNPVLPPPYHTLIPIVNTAKAVGWAKGETPTPAQGLAVTEFAGGLEHPRMLHVLPNGDVLVAESNKDAGQTGFSVRKWAEGIVKSRVGARAASANRITLLRDADGDGVAEISKPFLTGLLSPFGMALIGDIFYVANTDAVMAYPYAEGETQITAKGEKIADLPAGPINHHWTKDMVASLDGKSLYVGVGSNSNVGENGMAAEENRAAILKIDLATRKMSLFASGLRNPNGLCWNPDSGDLWAVVNERDELGSDLVPDYMTSIREGGFYGWPYSYYGQHVDIRAKPPRPDLVAKAIVPDYALGNHTGSLGLTFNTGGLFGPDFAKGAFVGQHGSWNRKPFSGYKVIFVPFAGGKPAGPPKDILTGFLSKDDKARGRPVGVAMDARGALLVADDVGNKVWRVTPAVAAK